MQASRGRDIGNQERLSRVRRARIPGVSVWALIGIALLIWGKSSEGQGAGRQEIRSVPGQVVHHPRQLQATAPLIRSGPLMQSAVTIDGGKLSVSLKEARIHDVMEAIARQSGIQIIFVGQAAQATLTEFFSGLPLEDGLRRLLRGESYLLMYSETEREKTSSIAGVMSEALNTERFAEAVKAAITAAGGMTEEDRAPEGTVAAELTSTFQRLLSERGGAKFLDDRLQRLLQEQLQ
jgi:hypothetical protein